MSLPSFLLAVLTAFFFAFSPVFAFTFTPGTPTQCDQMPISWTGGTPPFQLTIIPVFGVPQNISIPASSFSNGKGTFSFQVPVAEKLGMLLSMSDATGWNTGGTTNILTVGASKGGTCGAASKVDFSFQLNTQLQQCRPILFTAFTGAVQPITIYAVVPGGNSIVLNAPLGSTSFSWTVNAPSQTSFIFFMVDAQGRQGGSTDVRTVGTTDDNSCLDNQSPTSTTNAPSPTKTGSPSGSSSPTNSSPSHDKNGGTSVGAIVGAIIGALVLLGVIITLGLFFLRKRREASKATSTPPTGPWNAPAPPPARYSSYGVQQSGQHSAVHLTYDSSQSSGGPPFAGAVAGHPYPHTPTTAGLPYDDPNPFSDSTSPYQTPAPSSQFAQHMPYSDNPGQYQPSTAPYQAPIPPYQATSAPYETPMQYQQPPYDPYRSPPQTYPPPPLHPPAGLAADPLRASATSSTLDFDPYATNAMDPSASSSQGSASTGQRKAAVAGAGTGGYQPSRFVVHTDAEDILPPPNDDGVVELPPQYSERRIPPGSGFQNTGRSGKGPLP